MCTRSSAVVIQQETPLMSRGCLVGQVPVFRSGRYAGELTSRGRHWGQRRSALMEKALASPRMNLRDELAMVPARERSDSRQDLDKVSDLALTHILTRRSGSS